MEKFKKEVSKLNTDIEFTEFLSAEEDAKKVHNTLIGEALEKGKKEEKIEIAKNLLGLQMKISDIVKATGLTEKEIMALNEK